ncbi:MAG: hypothetical protein Q7W16_07000 [Coriobacteriia bacterium]|nr:hypothetical protein [Coriobacteriia bacterium]
MTHKVACLLAVALLSATVMVGCGPDPQEAYTVQTSGITNEWNAIVDRWNATPGDPEVVTDFIGLQSRAKQIEPPDELADAHRLFLEAMEAEVKSFEVWAVGAKEESARLHELSLKAITAYQKDLQGRGLLK